MYKLNELYALLNEIAPIELSEKLVQSGEYDNSGIIIKCSDSANKVLFSLDLSAEAVRVAKRNSCDTIVTHHPAIYRPIRSLSIDGEEAAVLYAAECGLNVISMHLNLDVASDGIDTCLCKAAGAEKYKILQHVTPTNGYGREFSVKGLKLKDLKKRISRNLNTNKIVCYGKPSSEVKTAASFCGGGSSNALTCVNEKLTEADVIITSDMPHHVIKALVERDKKIILIPHYAAEEYGFNKFYQTAKDRSGGKAEFLYFADRRFR